jgi:hypothetical protein
MGEGEEEPWDTCWTPASTLATESRTNCSAANGDEDEAIQATRSTINQIRPDQPI